MDPVFLILRRWLGKGDAGLETGDGMYIAGVIQHSTTSNSPFFRFSHHPHPPSSIYLNYDVPGFCVTDGW